MSGRGRKRLREQIRVCRQCELQVRAGIVTTWHDGENHPRIVISEGEGVPWSFPVGGLVFIRPATGAVAACAMFGEPEPT